MKRKLMVVDDSRIEKLHICRLLEDSSYEVAAYCENGEEALARYGDVQPDFVAMDIIMPGIDGLETAQILLEEHPEARILLISSLDSISTVSAGQEIGARGFLHKPLSRERLLAALEEALEEL